MNVPEARRVPREVTADEKARLANNRGKIAAELPDLAARDRMRSEAQQEATLSGELRRAIHVHSMSLTNIAKKAGISLLVLDEFLTGERTLRSDVMDRLASVLGYALQPVTE